MSVISLTPYLSYIVHEKIKIWVDKLISFVLKFMIIMLLQYSMLLYNCLEGFIQIIENNLLVDDYPMILYIPAIWKSARIFRYMVVISSKVESLKMSKTLDKMKFTLIYTFFFIVNERSFGTKVFMIIEIVS